MQSEMKMQRHPLARASFATVALCLSAFVAEAPGAVIVNFKPVPTSSTLPEFTWNGVLLDEGAGNIGNGDGALSLVNQTAPGLQFDVPFIINGVPGSSVNVASGTTTFFDGTLSITGFGPAAPAQNVLGTLVQPLGTGDFTLTSTTGILLLHGTVSGSTITGASGGSAGATFSSANVAYDSGLIFNALNSQGGTLAGNDFSFSFVDVSPVFGAVAGQPLNAFTSNATGLFNATVLPEPTSAAVVGVASGLLLLRPRRRA